MTDVTRRDMFAVGAVGAVAAVGLAKGAAAAEMTAQEKAHVAIVKEFCSLWGKGGAALNDIMGHMTDDVSFKINGQPPITGKNAVAASFNSFFKNGEKYEMIIHDTWAKGPTVVHYRIDTTIKTTGREPPGPIVAFYVFKDMKISEWEEVIYKA